MVKWIEIAYIYDIRALDRRFYFRWRRLLEIFKILKNPGIKFNQLRYQLNWKYNKSLVWFLSVVCWKHWSGVLCLIQYNHVFSLHSVYLHYMFASTINLVKNIQIVSEQKQCRMHSRCEYFLVYFSVLNWRVNTYSKLRIFHICTYLMLH